MLLQWCLLFCMMYGYGYGYGINSLNMEKPYNWEAIYQFGDSLADTGNLVRESGNASNLGCGWPPYGHTFFHRPTGRCSDGLLIIDFFAQALQLPFLDPYLDKDGNFTHGVNFAVAGATALNVSTLADKNIIAADTNTSLMVQLDWFKSHLRTIHSTSSEGKKKLGKALFFVGEVGGNDYGSASFQGKTMDEIRALVPEVIHTIITVVKEVIELGAKRIIVPGYLPVGCLPAYLAAFKADENPTMYDELNCLSGWNEFAMFHNELLQISIKDLQKECPNNVSIVYADYYTALTTIIKQAPSLGFEEDGLQKACCGSGNNDYNYDSKRRCGSTGVTACPDPNKRLSWDGVHLTQHTYQLMANSLLKYILPSYHSTS